MTIEINNTTITLDEKCLAGYKVKEFIASGTYGSVHVVHNVQNKCDHVVKAQLLADKEDAGDFTAETTYAAMASKHGYGPRLHLEHCCPLDDDNLNCVTTVMHSSPPYATYPQVGLLVMDKYDTMYDTSIDAEKPRPFETLRLQVMRMHRAGVVHSDLLGKNVMTKGKDVRLIDWGLSFLFHENVPKQLTWATKNEEFDTWYTTVVAKYMIPWFDVYYARPALEIIMGVLQWDALAGGMVAYQTLILLPKPNENMTHYMARANEGSHFVLLDWALPYTEWLRHGGIVIKVLVKDTISSQSGQYISLYVLKDETVATVRTRLHALLQTELYQHQKIHKTPTLRFGKRVLKETDTLKRMGITHGSKLVEV